MKRFVEGEDRRQATLLPDCLDASVTEDNPVRVIEVFIDELDWVAMGFAGMLPAATGRPAYHPATLLKIDFSGDLNRIPSSRRLERETQRNIELIWLTGRLMPDFKTIADFCRDNGPAIRAACAQFVVLCRQFNLFTRAVVAVDGSRFKAVNNRDKTFTVAKATKRPPSASSRSRPAWRAPWQLWIAPTGRTAMGPRPRQSASRRRSKACGGRCNPLRRWEGRWKPHPTSRFP
jgi:transposase